MKRGAGKTGYPQIDVLTEEAENLYQWAMDHGLTAPPDRKILAQWAEHFVNHELGADAAAREFPQLVSEAWGIKPGPIQDIPDDTALPTYACFAIEYLKIAARLLEQQQASAANVVKALAIEMLQLARKAMDKRSRLNGPRKGGENRVTPGKEAILLEAYEMLDRNLSKSNVAHRLAEKYDIPFSTIRDWLKEPSN